MSRSLNRLKALAGAAVASVRYRKLAQRPDKPSRILVLHELLLGDTLMLAPLLAGLRLRYPGAEILVTVRPGYEILFSGRPYGVTALPFSEREPDALSALAPAENPDIAILPGENRYAVFARALGAKWIVAFPGAKPAWKDRAADELVPLPSTPMALADMFVLLAGQKRTDAGTGFRFAPDAWPAPAYKPFEMPLGRYAVLHVGAGSPLRLWSPEKWRGLATSLVTRGLIPVWSASGSEAGLVHEIDPEYRHASYAGKLDLAQLWHLLAGAECAVTLDTGIAHLAKLTRTRTVTLFGPGSETLFGKGQFWEGNDFHAITPRGFPCRDQHALFKREIPWVQRCNRTHADCPRARCMEAIAVERVLDMIS